MQLLFGAFAGAAAPAAATAAAPVAATAASGFSLSQVLSGGATLLSAVSSIAAGNAKADELKAQAQDAQMQKPLEVIQGLQRRNEIKRATMQAVGDIDTATAASGADLTFGTPAQARKAAFREGDFAANSNTWTTGSTVDRLELRRKEYLRMAGKARLAGVFEGLTTGLTGFARLSSIGGPAT